MKSWVWLFFFCSLSVHCQDVNLNISWEMFDQIQQETPVEERNEWSMDSIFISAPETRFFFSNTYRVYPRIPDDLAFRVASGLGVGTAGNTGGRIFDGNPAVVFGYNHQNQADPEVPLWRTFVKPSDEDLQMDESTDYYIVDKLNKNMKDDAREKFGRLLGITWSSNRTWIIALNFQNFTMRKARGSRNFHGVSENHPVTIYPNRYH